MRSRRKPANTPAPRDTHGLEPLRARAAAPAPGRPPHSAGRAAPRGPGPQGILSAGLPAEAERLRPWNPPFRNLIGTGATPAFDVQPDRLISERTSVVVGGTEFVLIPVRGGEPPDALMVYLPASGLLFTGDVMMTYVGVPFIPEGRPEGRLDTLRSTPDLAPRSAEETAAALDLLAGEKADASVTAAATLAGQGDLALALDILTPGLLRHPDSSELAELRQAVLVRLMEQRQPSDPFGFLVYAELAGAELPPVG